MPEPKTSSSLDSGSARRRVESAEAALFDDARRISWSPHIERFSYLRSSKTRELIGVDNRSTLTSRFVEKEGRGG